MTTRTLVGVTEPAEALGAAPIFTIAQMFLSCAGLPETIAFYRDTLGLASLLGGPDTEQSSSTTVASRAVGPTLVLDAGQTSGIPYDSRITLMTADLATAFAYLEARGAEVIQEPIHHLDGVRDCAFLDPSGNIVRIQQTPAAHEGPRDCATRKADALATLTSASADGWVATTSSSADSHPQGHLVPLSLAWINECVVIAVPDTSKTARNLRACPTARIGAGTTRDVVMLEVELEDRLSASSDEALRSAYQAQAGWDPGREAGYEFLILRPTRIQAWRERNEMPGRELMIDGLWLD
jgi:catechol 2,3-dioxygenase-like lactoylglutathione lyase family enzyme